ncbi:MAG: hypothetical protein ACE5J3_11375, partial [Methanosarcinales archaeon]
LKKNISGCIGAFIIDKNANMIKSNLPKMLSDSLKNTSTSLYYLTEVIKEKRELKEIIYEIGDIKIVLKPVNQLLLGVLVPKDVNLPLLNLMIGKAALQLEKIPEEELKEKLEEKEVLIEEIRENAIKKIKDVLNKFYGDKAANKAIKSAFKKIGTSQDKASAEDLKKIIRIIGDKKLIPIMGSTAAEKKVEEILAELKL